MSYANLILFSSVLPSYDTDKKDNKADDRTRGSKSDIPARDEKMNYGQFLSVMKGLKR